MAKYPGEFIINEVGTRKELAALYGVSERTIYRWLNKAAKESGQKLRVKTRHPKPSTLQKFTGTRKQLAKKYGVSERTAYRWLKKAKMEGVDIPNRRGRSKYPGPGILNDKRSSKTIAQEFGVSRSTVNRWKRKARQETEPTEILPPVVEQPQPVQRPIEDIGEPWEVLPPDEDIGEPWEVPEPDDVGEPWEVPPPDEDIGEPWEVPEPEISQKVENQISEVIDLIFELDLIDAKSAFMDLSRIEQIIYLNEYFTYLLDHNPYVFCKDDSDEPYVLPLDEPDRIATANVWGDDFENWLANQIEINNTDI